jgi:HEAT repeat protein
VIGKQYEEIALCGRPTVLAPQLLNPRDLKLYPAKVQRLAPSERNQAVRLMAARLDASAKLGPALLRAAGASSAVGSPQSLTDGNLSTTWAEQRGAEGRGEFIVFNAPPQLPIAGLDFVVKPMGGDAPAAGVAVREFWLVTADRVRHVLMPEDAWQGPGGVYRVMLDQPVQTSCIALVIESAFGTGQDQQVTFTEVTAISEFNPDDLPGLVGALAGGGQRAEAAKTVLMSGGPEAFRAVANAYRTLDEGGRRVALAVMDQASCEVATPTYVRALLSRYEAHASHAKERLRRCARKSADYLVETLRVARPRAWVILANELGLIAPDRAVSEIARLFDASSKARRSSLRVAFARAAMDRSAEPAVQRLLLDTKLPQTSRLEALRSLGSAAEQFGDAADGAFASLAQNRDFRTRFLLLQPAASLSLSNAKARFFLSEALTKDPNPHMRYGAAVAAGGVGHLQNELIHATKDRAVRVRKAAVEALGHRRVAAAEAALVRRLVDDRWPMVRSVAAEALGGLGSSAEADEALARALKDASPIVRAPVVQALGRRRVASAAPDLRDRLEDDDEDAAVRRAAAQALGRLCDYKSLDSLTELAVRRSDPLLDQQQRGLALAALEALAALGPSDLRQRLRPLFSAGAAPGARAAAERVLGMQPGCSVR